MFRAIYFSVIFFNLAFILIFGSTLSLGAESLPLSKRQQVLKSAQHLFETREVSYVYGGYQLGSNDECAKCTACLEAKQPGPKVRTKSCPICLKCSLDCSHFTQLVYQKAGLGIPYLETDSMLNYNKRKLLKSYQLVDVGSDVHKAKPGDLLVYRGHVVMLEKLFPNGRGDIIHATGGREIRLPGQGIQRKRQALITRFHGPLLRILRHRELMVLRGMRAVK